MKEPLYIRISNDLIHIEGELIQDIYFMFKTFKLSPHNDHFQGVTIPNESDIEKMKELLREMFISRSKEESTSSKYRNQSN